MTIIIKPIITEKMTQQGESLAVDVGAGQVGGARVLKSEKYDNGIVYVIDRVMVPIGLSM